jgi:UDP-N-acetylmuramoyl-tripeptide--D-alanyl-D-alanine ligase
MNLWILIYNLFLLSSLPRFLKWLYLWQKKEYRGDKMLDYLSLPEGRKMVLDKWFVSRVFVLYFLWLSTQFSVFEGLESNSFLNSIKQESLGYSLEFAFISNLTILVLILVFGIMVLEIIEFFAKLVLKKKVLLPEYSTKLVLHFTISLLTIIFIPVFFNELRFLGFFYVLNLFYILIPLIIGYWLLAMFPVDWLIKENLFKKARNYRTSLENLNIIAVSGSYGKTTTKEILDQLLGVKFKTEKTLKNQNSSVSCARKLLKLKTDTEQFICELGSYKQGDGNEICQFLLPDMAVITGLNHQHFALFGSTEKIIQAETESLNFLPVGALVVVNWCSELNRKIVFSENLKVLKIGVEGFGVDSNEVDYFAQKVKFDNQKLQTEFELILPDKQIVKLSTNLLSLGNVQNLVQAMVVGLELGLKIEEMQKVMLNLVQPAGTLELIKKDENSQGLVLLNDSYNANFDGVINAVDLIAQMQGQKMLILDDILELGKLSVDLHKKLAKKIAEVDLDEVVLVGRNFGELIRQELLSSGFDKNRITFWNEGRESTNKIELTIKQFATGNNNQKSEQKSKQDSKVILFEGYQSKKFLEVVQNWEQKKEQVVDKTSGNIQTNQLETEQANQLETDQKLESAKAKPDPDIKNQSNKRG